MDVGETPLFHGLLRPVGRFLDVRRAGQTGTVHIGEVALRLHHLRALQPFFFDAVDGVEVDLFGDRPVRCERKRRQDGDEGANQERVAGFHDEASLLTAQELAVGLAAIVDR